MAVIYGVDVGKTTGHSILQFNGNDVIHLAFWDDTRVLLSNGIFVDKFIFELPVSDRKSNNWLEVHQILLEWERYIQHLPQNKISFVSPGVWKPVIKNLPVYKQLTMGIKSNHIKDAIGIAYWGCRDHKNLDQ